MKWLVYTTKCTHIVHTTSFYKGTYEFKSWFQTLKLWFKVMNSLINSSLCVLCVDENVCNKKYSKNKVFCRWFFFFSLLF